MIHKLSRFLTTLVALFAISTGAWAQQKYNVTFSGFDNASCNTTITDVTLPYSKSFGKTDACSNAYDIDGSSTNEQLVGASFGGDNFTITVKSAFEGTVTVSVGGETEWFDPYSRNITVACVPAEAPITVEPVEGKTNEWTFAMPGSNVELQVEYYPGMLVKPTNLVGGTMEIEGLTDTTLPEGFEKDDDGNIYVAKDTKFTVKAVPAEGYHLVGWSDDAENKELEREFTMGDDDFILTATFSDEYDLAFNALNANTIEDGKATVKVGDTDKTADIQDGKLTGVKYGQNVTLTAAQGYKFRKVEVKKGAEDPLADLKEKLTECTNVPFGEWMNNMDTSVTKEQALALAEYLYSILGVNVRVFYDDGDSEYIKGIRQDGHTLNCVRSNTNTISTKAYYVAK